MDNIETKTVINIGWEAVRSSLMKNFSAFAEKGYILSEMDDKQFIFKKAEPRSAEFYLYSAAADKRGSEYRALTENGWTELCSYGEYHMMTAPKDTPLPEIKKSALQEKAPFIIAVLIFAVLLAAAILVIPKSTKLMQVIRTVLIGISAGGMVFVILKLLPKKNDGDDKQ